MELQKIGQICDINPKTSIDLMPDKPISFIPMNAVSVDGNIDVSKTISLDAIKNYTVFQNGDILFAKITPCMENGKGAVADKLKNGYGAGSTEFIVLRPNKELVTQKWLQLFLSQKTFRLYCQQHMTGTAGQKRVPPKFLANCDIPAPPLSEQERIVARIEELFSQLDASVNELKTAKARLKVYRQAVLSDAFAKYHTFDALRNVSERIFDGPFGANLKTADYVDQGIRVVRLENLKNAWFDDTKRSFVTEEKYKTISSHTVYPNDLIMSTFISESIKICQLPKEAKFAVNKADCVGIRLKSEMNPRFIMFYLSSREAYNALIHQVHGATRPRVNTKQIKAIQIPVSDIQEQITTVAKIDKRLSACDNIEKTVDTALQQAEALRQSILKKAFEGGL